MKSILRLLLPLLLVGCTHTYYLRKPLKGEAKLTITHVIPLDDGSTEIWAINSYRIFLAKCKDLPHPLKKGMVITASPESDTIKCNTCIFKRVK
ncbi:MAG: hypothetical protein KAY50_09780 [Chitinophagaceae bacterium]|nr:hypothetical protein [Chitinophagaceae bacterium]